MSEWAWRLHLPLAPPRGHLSQVGLFNVWLAVEKKSESIKASGETIAIMCAVITGLSRRALGA
jgi:hypothetical protein